MPARRTCHLIVTCSTISGRTSTRPLTAGKSWTNISGNLPAKAYVQVVREDPKNTNLLYAGTELGLFASYNGGKEWFPLNLKNLPNVAVHDIVVHPRENDLILATHGRSIWIFDDASVHSTDDAADHE